MDFLRHEVRCYLQSDGTDGLELVFSFGALTLSNNAKQINRFYQM